MGVGEDCWLGGGGGGGGGNISEAEMNSFVYSLFGLTARVFYSTSFSHRVF